MDIDKKSSEKPKKGRRRWALPVLVVLAILAIGAGIFAFTRPGPPPPVDLSVVMSQVNSGAATKAEITPSGPTVTVTLKDGTEQTAYYPSAYADTLTTTLLSKNVPTTTTPPKSDTWSTVVDVILSLLPMALFLGFFIWVIKSGAMGGGIAAMRGGRGSAIGKVPDVRFSDVAGADEAVSELTEVVDFLSRPERYTALGAVPPRGALLVGPPGTGKTLLARAVAGEAGVPFFPIAGSDFVETFVGVGARRVRDLFDQAKKAGKAIIFVDEIDAVGRARSEAAGGDTERDSTLIAMLNEMDGFNASGLIVLAATNRPELLDPALMRPGRLDRQVQVPLPDRRGREQILAVHLRGKPTDDTVNMAAVAIRTPGFSGADLARVVNDAAIIAAREGQKSISGENFNESVSTVALGRARTSALVTENDRNITAWHEAGHTLAAIILPDADDPVQVSITPRGPAGGVTWMSGNDDLFLTKSSAQAGLAVSLAGREAEKLLLDGDYTSGAHSDLAAATRLATEMITAYGMGEELAVLDLNRGIGAAYDVAHTQVNALLEQAATVAGTLLEKHKKDLATLAAALLVEETMTLAQVRQLLPDLERTEPA